MVFDLEMGRVNPSDLEKGSIKHFSFPESFIRRVRDFKQALAEVELSSLESTLNDFQRDAHPEQELVVWEHIAMLYQWAIVENPGLSLPQKKEVLSLLLGLSMLQQDFSNIKLLSKEVIDEITARY